MQSNAKRYVFTSRTGSQKYRFICIRRQIVNQLQKVPGFKHARLGFWFLYRRFFCSLSGAFTRNGSNNHKKLNIISSLSTTRSIRDAASRLRKSAHRFKLSPAQSSTRSSHHPGRLTVAHVKSLRYWSVWLFVCLFTGLWVFWIFLFYVILQKQEVYIQQLIFHFYIQQFTWTELFINAYNCVLDI